MEKLSERSQFIQATRGIAEYGIRISATAGLVTVIQIRTASCCGALNMTRHNLMDWPQPEDRCRHVITVLIKHLAHFVRLTGVKGSYMYTEITDLLVLSQAFNKKERKAH